MKAVLRRPNTHRLPGTQLWTSQSRDYKVTLWLARQVFRQVGMRLFARSFRPVALCETS